MSEYKPYRFSADADKLPGKNFCMVKLGFFFNSLKGIWEFWRYSNLIKKSAKKGTQNGLLHTEVFLYSNNHAGLIQYWESFEKLEAWALGDSEHKKWWKEMEKENKWKDMIVYHEAFIIDKAKVETIYNLAPNHPKDQYPGMAAFLPHLSPAEYRARKRFLKDPAPES
jgi:hypothetical protein